VSGEPVTSPRAYARPKSPFVRQAEGGWRAEGGQGGFFQEEMLFGLTLMAVTAMLPWAPPASPAMGLKSANRLESSVPGASEAREIRPLWCWFQEPSFTCSSRYTSSRAFQLTKALQARQLLLRQLMGDSWQRKPPQCCRGSWAAGCYPRCTSISR